MVHHYCRLVLVVLLGVLLLLPTTSALAGSPEVTITVSAWTIGYPSNFTLTYISDSQVDLAWTKAVGTENTLIRAASGHVPVDRTDGYQVYYGDGESHSDTALTLASPEIVYYRAWGETAGGSWSPLFASGDTEDFMSASFLFLGWILLSGLLTHFALRVNLMLFRLAAALSWVGLGIWLLLSDSTNLQMSDTWTQVLGTVFLVVAIGVLTLQMKADITHEATVRKGSSKEEVISWTERSSLKRKAPTAGDRQASYRNEVKKRMGR